MGSREPVPGSDIDAPKSGRLSIGLLLIVVVAAFAVKFLVFGLSVWTSMNLSLPNAENWQDFSLAYMPAAYAFRSGFLPYNDFFYPYPPLFLYVLAAFSYLPLPSWSGAIPLVAADALTVVPLYLIARKFSGERNALLASALYILAPTNLYYADYLWLNPPLTTLFLMVSLYLILEKRYDLSALTLAVSIGFKQTALLALPFLLLVIWKGDRGRAGAGRYLLITGLACLLMSLPYLFTSPGAYLASIFRVPTDLWTAQLPSSYFQIGVGTGTPVSFNTLDWMTSKWQLVASAVNAPVSLGLPIFIFLVPSALAWVYGSYYTDLLWLVLFVGYLLLLRRVWKAPQIIETDALRYMLYALLFLFTIYPSYKYYTVGAVPLLVLLVRNKKDLLGFAAFSFSLLFVPRYLSSWVLLAALVWLLRLPILKRFGPSRPEQLSGQVSG